MKKSGLSMIELLVVMTVMSILLVSFSAIFSNSVNRMQQEFTQSQVQSEAQTLLDRIQNEIKLGRTTEPSFTYEGRTYNTTVSSVVILMPSIDENDNVLYNGQNPLLDRVIYFKDGNMLNRLVVADPSSKRYVDGGSLKTLSESVTNLSFTYGKANLSSTLVVDVETLLTISKKSGKITKSSTVKSKASFRNLP